MIYFQVLIYPKLNKIFSILKYRLCSMCIIQKEYFMQSDWGISSSFSSTSTTCIWQYYVGISWSELDCLIISSNSLRTTEKCFEKIKTTSTGQITTVLSRVGKRVTLRVGKISLRVGSCPPLPTLGYTTAHYYRAFLSIRYCK